MRFSIFLWVDIYKYEKINIFVNFSSYEFYIEIIGIIRKIKIIFVVEI